MRLETRTLYSLLLPHNGLGAPRARPPERSGDRGAPRAKAKGVRGGEAPRIQSVQREDEQVAGILQLVVLHGMQVAAPGLHGEILLGSDRVRHRCAFQSRADVEAP